MLRSSRELQGYFRHCCNSWLANQRAALYVRCRTCTESDIPDLMSEVTVFMHYVGICYTWGDTQLHTLIAYVRTLGSMNWALRPSLSLQTNTLLQLANCSSHSVLSQIYCLEVNLLVPSASLCRLSINNVWSTKCKLSVLPFCFRSKLWCVNGFNCVVLWQS